MSDLDQTAMSTHAHDAERLLTQPSQSWRVARSVPFRVAVTVPVRGVKLRDLLALRRGSRLLSSVSAAEDVPVRAGGALLGWAELDNVDGQMAIRLMRLA